MKQIVTIGDQKVAIRGMKFRELKEFAGAGREKLQSLFQLLEEEDLLAGVERFALENLEGFTRIVEQFTDLTQEKIDELELTELMQLVQELFQINGITVQKATDFFTAVSKLIHSGSGDDQRPMAFSEQVPVMP